MRRRHPLAALCALVIVALSAVAVWQNDRDDRASSRALLAQWRSLGGSLLRPSLQSAWSGDGLSCFTYELERPTVDEESFCFDPERRLVETLFATSRRVWLVGVAATPSRSPVRLSARELRRADVAATAVQVAVHTAQVAARTLASKLRPSFKLCDRPIRNEYRRVTLGRADRTELLAQFRGTALHCAAAATATRAATAKLTLSPQIVALGDRLADLASSLAALAETSLHAEAWSTAAAVAQVRREFVVRSQIVATLRQLRKGAVPAQPTSIAQQGR